MYPETLIYDTDSGYLYQIIEPGHYRPCGGIDFSSLPSFSIVTNELGEMSERQYDTI